MELSYESNNTLIIIKTPHDGQTMEELVQYFRQLCLAAGYSAETVEEYLDGEWVCTTNTGTGLCSVRTLSGTS